jgi:hypothetical protein
MLAREHTLNTQPALPCQGLGTGQSPHTTLCPSVARPAALLASRPPSLRPARARATVPAIKGQGETERNRAPQLRVIDQEGGGGGRGRREGEEGGGESAAYVPVPALSMLFLRPACAAIPVSVCSAVSVSRCFNVLLCMCMRLSQQRGRPAMNDTHTYDVTAFQPSERRSHKQITVGTDNSQAQGPSWAHGHRARAHKWHRGTRLY